MLPSQATSGTIKPGIVAEYSCCHTLHDLQSLPLFAGFPSFLRIGSPQQLQILGLPTLLKPLGAGSFALLPSVLSGCLIFLTFL